MTIASLTPLGEREITAKLKKIPKWEAEAGMIRRQFRFKDFIESVAFVNCVATLAERENHHPDILISYNEVTLTLTTHNAGGLTDRDFNLAEQIDRLISGTVEE